MCAAVFCGSGDPKNAHLKQLDGASEMLSLFKADVLDAGELSAAIAGCEGVFHVASPVPGDKIVDPEVKIPSFINHHPCASVQAFN